MPDSTPHFSRKKILIVLLTIIIITALVSSTIGRDLYLQRTPNLFSFAVLHFSGYLFFLLMPVEAAFIYYLMAEYTVGTLVGLALLTAVAAQLIDYFIGYKLSSHFIENFVRRERYEQAEKYILKYGNITLFIFNVLPLSSPILVLAAGMLKYPIKDVLIYSILGLGVKYIVLALLV